MPAQRIHDTTDVGLYDVVGMDSTTKQNFVCHVALCAAGVKGHDVGDSVPITHMRPPFFVADDFGPIQTTGCAYLDDDERQAMRAFIMDYDSEQRAAVDRLAIITINYAERANEIVAIAQYRIRPHAGWFRRRIGDATVQLRQFSCAGFVVEAYKEAGIPLVVTDEGSLPGVHLQELCDAYPDFAGFLQDKKQREKKNLPGDGPWPVVLAGYEINALASVGSNAAESRVGLPYQPQPHDSHFPPRN